MAASADPMRGAASSAAVVATEPRCEASDALRGVRLRPVAPADDAFLLVLYGSTRAQELAMLPWSEDQKRSFVRMQFDAQTRFYGHHFTGARHSIVEREGRSIGRLYVDRTAEEIRIVDIVMIPEVRGRGIGGALIAEVLGEARAAQLPVRIHVEKHNPAMGLYQRLGFEMLADHGVYWLMERKAPSAEAQRDQLKSAS